MADPNTDLAAKVAVNLITETLKASLIGLKSAKDWFKSKSEEHDFFGRAARKYAAKVEERYNSMRIFGMNEPIPLRNIYTRVSILGRITARHQATIEDLERFFDRDFRNFGYIQETKEGFQVINELNKVIVLGKPGAGKTTFLKYTALQALDGNLSEPRVPVFISLKDWSDSDSLLFDFIVRQFDICDLPEASPLIEQMLLQGKCLLLLDGFDEVSRSVDLAIQQIRNFSEKYSKNKFVLSCRIAAYNYCFERFTEVEIADFSSRQIESFVNNWFGKGSKKARACIHELGNNKPIQELATIPLLLTMLCLAFDETMGFPANRAELYKEAIDALLKKWDASRSIKREEIYRHLSLRRKESLFSRIAAITFEKDQYFFSQRLLEKEIAAYIQNLPEAQQDMLEIDSEVILKAIEAQHGIFVERAKKIYSFSHLTFQEYFTARYLVENAIKGTLAALVKDYITKDKWREVFLLTAGMLEEADSFFLLMQEQINSFGKETIGYFLDDVQDKVMRKHSTYVPAACRALLFYYTLVVLPDSYGKDIALALAQEIDPFIKRSLSQNSPSEVLERAFYSNLAIASIQKLKREHTPALQTYLKMNKLLFDCLQTECYVSLLKSGHI
jgi:NACHT domain